MQNRNYFLCLILLFCASISCRNQQIRKVNLSATEASSKIYESLAEKYSNKLLLTSINSLYERKKLSVNGSNYDFPDIYELDSLNEESKLKNQVLHFFSSHDSDQVEEKIKSWCDSYLLLDAFFSINTDIYFEELASKEKRFRPVISHYFSIKEQDINSLSSSQSQMLYLDFARFLSNYTINERVTILDNAGQSKSW